jgi:hypothetical protein
VNDRDDDWDLPEIAPIKSRSQGRGLPVPPVIPIVAAVCLMFGLAMGYRMAPGPGPTPSPPPDVALATPAPTETLASYYQWTLNADASPAAAPVAADVAVITRYFMEGSTPPPGGLSLGELLKNLAGRSWGIAPENVVSARVAPYRDVSVAGAKSDLWVWVVNYRIHRTHTFTTEACYVVPVDGATPAAQNCPDVETTQTLIFEYTTGEFLELQSWSIP